MAKTKVKYCSECGKRTVHKFVGHESVAEGLGLARGMLAVVSLGLSETVGSKWYYQCEKCGNITSK